MVTQNIVYAHSGGVTSVLNTTASSLIATARKHQLPTLIAQNGILGLIHNKLYRTDNLSSQDLERLAQTPSSVFGSCRHKLPHHHDDPRAWDGFFNTIAQHNIDCIIYQGGNDSQDTSVKILEAATQRQIALKCYGIPKTIDNDLYGTDFSPGFPSCAKYLCTSIAEASLDTRAMCKSSTKVFIMEVMGRHTGWLALATAMASRQQQQGPHIILTPEHPVDVQQWLAYTDHLVKELGYCVIVASEGIINSATGNRLTETKQTDAFGHGQLGGVGAQLAQWINTHLNYKTHYAIPDYLQRSAGHLRAAIDVYLAKQLGQRAIELVQEQADSCLLGLQRSEGDWHIIPTSLHTCANREKPVPLEYFSDNKMHISPLGREYFQPLIAGEVYPTYHQGLPEYFDASQLHYQQQPQPII